MAEEYVDNDLSGYSVSGGRGMSGCWPICATGERDAVIVDRLTRRPIELEQFLEALDPAKVRQVRFMVGDTDLSTGDGILVAMAANKDR